MAIGIINKISYFDGQRKKKISENHLKDIKSRVITHEGEVLRGDSAKRYQEKYGRYRG